MRLNFDHITAIVYPRDGEIDIHESEDSLLVGSWGIVYYDIDQDGGWVFESNNGWEGTTGMLQDLVEFMKQLEGKKEEDVMVE